MDDLTNCFNSFVTSDDYCSHTNLASNIHPRLIEYKKKSTIKSQEVRRRQILEEQKKKRKELIQETRHIPDKKEIRESKKQDEIPDENLPKTKKSTHKKAPYSLMLSEWLEEIPYDFESNWIMCLCPVGKRCLVVASEGTTTIYNKGGRVIYKHQSKLPGGSNESKIDYTVLDCIYDDVVRTYYVLDCLCWKSHPILDTETEFRFYWLKCKLEETPKVNIISAENPYKFVDIPRFHGCSKQTIEDALKTDFPFQLDGILFYHKETHYTCDYTPLVGWLKPYMLPEILNINVPETILKTAPSDYINAKSTILNSNIEIERFKNYLTSKIASSTSSPISTASSSSSSSPAYSANSMEINEQQDKQNFLQENETEQ